MRWLRVPLLMACLAACSTGAVAQDEPRIDYLSLAQGALPVVIGGDANALRVGMDHALLAIDGNGGGFSMTPKPGTAESRVEIVYALPALTTFDTFAIPNVRETPSPSQTFFRNVEIAGSDTGPERVEATVPCRGRLLLGDARARGGAEGRAAAGL